MIRPYVCYLQTDWDQYLDQLEFANNKSEHTSPGQTPFLVTHGQHPNTMDDVLLRAPPDGEDSSAVQELLNATERPRTLAREAIEQMNSRMAEHINAHRCDVQFQIWDSVLLSKQNLRLPVCTTRAKKFASRFIGPCSVVNRIADGHAYRLDLQSHMHLYPFFYVSYLNVMSTIISRLVFVSLRCRTYSRTGMRRGNLMLLCRTDGGPHIYSI
jgi:hypothetical protein